MGILGMCHISSFSLGNINQVELYLEFWRTSLVSDE